MEAVCRLCSKKSTQLTSIYSFQKDRLLSDMILIICPIKIDAADELPKSICKTCLNLILDAIALRETSIKNDLKFRSNSLAMENPDIMKNSQDDDAFYSTTFFESDSEEEPKPKKSKRKKDDEDSGSEYKAKKIRRVDSGGPFKCILCPASFTFKTNVTRHLRNVHNYEEPIVKEIVPDLTSTTGIFCRICGMSFTFISNMKRHIRKIHPETDEETLAGYIKTANELRNKSKEVTNDESEDDSDNEDKRLGSKKSRKKKYKRGHGSEMCPVCDMAFTFTSNMRRHVRTVHPEISEQFLLNQCYVRRPILKSKKKEGTNEDGESDGSTDDDDKPLVDEKAGKVKSEN